MFISKKKFRYPLYVFIVIAVLVGVNTYLNFVLPIKTLSYDSTISVASSPKNITWPDFGQSAVGIVGQNDIITHNQQTPSQTASTAKLITILSVLNVRPLKLGDSGPTITMTPSDIAIYNQYVKEQGSVVQIVLGEKLTEYQILEAMLLPSANNLADALAIWAFGSLQNYSAYANNFLKIHGIDQTHVGKDASGYDPSTVSTAADLVKIGELAISNPVIAQIALTKQVTNFPVINGFNNLNFLIGQNGIIGLKTGNTDQAGGVFVSASIKNLNGRKVTIVTAVMKAKNLIEALNSSASLIASVQNSFTKQTLISSNQNITKLSLPWGQKVNIRLKNNLIGYSWISDYQKLFININPIKINTNSNQVIGNVSLKKDLYNNFTTENLYLNSSIHPPLKWLLFHINY